ncbi:hypothetical protein [Caulifigura coniformis]|uniref:hypothetical protein n=1 Tax=Caulifigura coniformis TaxID=2527983 RepID=UPI00119DA56F|nr:hypothetical protein [Caulifigura coniformis]
MGNQQMTERASRAIHYGEISFPSDKLTIGMLRSAYPTEFNQPISDDPQPRQPIFFWRTSGEHCAKEVVGGLLERERLVAATAAAEGASLVAPLCDLRAIKRRIMSEYMALGLAQGEYEAAELIRRLEDSARAAGANFGKSREASR